MIGRRLALTGQRPWETTALVIGGGSAAAALVPDPVTRVALWLTLFLAGFCCWMIRSPGRWLAALFFSLLLLPPFPSPIGNTSVHAAPFVALAGVLTGLIWIRRWISWSHPITLALMVFLGILLNSVALAAFYSGPAVALGSLVRVGLFALSVVVFLHAYAGPSDQEWNVQRITKILFGFAVLGAAFACVDFYFQFSPPAGYSDQFVYLQSGVFRRAQGFFYDASTLGNFCAFFITFTMISLIRRRDESRIARKVLQAGVIVLFGALMFSYSRASMLNVAAGTVVLGCIHLKQVRRPLTVLIGTGIVVAVSVHLAAPALSENYWGRLLGSFSFFEQSPDKVLSGRVTHWQSLADFLAWEPWHAAMGIGYKTLPYATFTGDTVIADNTYLELLVETGIAGLAAFLMLNMAILRTGWRALRSSNTEARFFGEWVFCFWCGEVVQMLSGDLITYWRVLPVYFWVIGIAARKARENP